MNVAVVIQLSVLAVALYVVFGSLAAAVAHSLFRQSLMKVEPARRARAFFALSVSPAVGAVGLTLLCFLPSSVDLLWSGVDHCLQHGDGHLHFCVVHAPSSIGSVGWLVAGSLAAVLLLRVLYSFSRMAHARRALRQLTRTAVFDHDRQVWVMDSDLPMAMTIGLWRPRIFVSTALLRTMSPELVAVVIEHERAHVRRRDVLRKLIAGLLSLVYPLRTRHRLLADLELASEQACDEEAGVQVGDRLRVAQALLRAQRLLHGRRVDFGLAGAGFDGPSVALRVESLLADALPPTSRRSARWLAAAVVTLALIAEPLHHQTEGILGFITR